MTKAILLSYLLLGLTILVATILNAPPAPGALPRRWFDWLADVMFGVILMLLWPLILCGLLIKDLRDRCRTGKGGWQ